MANFDAEGAMLKELAALRSLVVGETQAASRDGLQSFRMALRRLFAGFELVPLGDPPYHFITGKLDGEIWQGEDVPSFERKGTAYVLRPYVRSGAMKPLTDTDPSDWLALQRLALSLRDNFHSLLVA